MKIVSKYLKEIVVRLQIIKELFSMLWKRKLWWGIPIIFIILFFMIFLLIAGHTGVAAFIYPLF